MSLKRALQQMVMRHNPDDLPVRYFCRSLNFGVGSFVVDLCLRQY